MPQTSSAFNLRTLGDQLDTCKIQHKWCEGKLPSRTIMHNLDHEMPLLVIWPKNTKQVQQALQLIHPIRQIYPIPVSVISGGHGYDGKAMCKGITFDMQFMNECKMNGDQLYVQPGCGLRKVMDVLQKHDRIIPHGDSLTVGAGGHFISAGWDLVLTRKYGLGCQHVIAATMVFWDGTKEYVNSKNNPSLFHAIKGSFGNFEGIVTELKLQTFEAPNKVSLARVVLDIDHLPENIIQLAYHLPKEISTTFRFYFQKGKPQLTLILGTLLSKEKTVKIISESICANLAETISCSWECHCLSDVRFHPLKSVAKDDWESIVDMTTEEFEEVSEKYWRREVFLREMKVSFCQQRSYWIDVTTPKIIFQEILDFLRSLEPEFYERVYGNITVGGGTMWENREKVSMPIGKAIIRFESHSEELSIHRTKSKENADYFSKLASKFLEKKLIGCVYSGDEFKT